MYKRLILHKHILSALTFGALACGLAMSPVFAQSVSYHVSMGTSGLVSSSSGPFSLDFQFDDGGTLGNNAVTLTNFNFGGGSAGASPSTSGGASGNASSTITIKDTSLLNELVQTFTPGTTLTFDLKTTTNLNTAAGSSPDEFTFALLDKSGNEVVTTAPNSAFITIDLDSSNPTVTTAGTPSSPFMGSQLNIAAPSVRIAAVPEAGPAAWLVSMTGAFFVGIRLCRSRSKRVIAPR